MPNEPKNVRELSDVYADEGTQEQIDEEAPLQGVVPADDDDDAIEAAAGLPGDSGDEEETSLDVLVARRAVNLGGGEELDDDPDELIQLAPQPTIPPLEPLPTKVVPLRARLEFVCNRCHLVKARSQLADGERGLCRDCV